MKETKSLLVFSIGPVQSFISAARKVEDLWSGSYLLSFLTEKAILAVKAGAKNDAIDIEMVYPFYDFKKENNFDEGDFKTASLPNRFVCLVKSTQEKAAGLAKFADQKVREEYINLCNFAIVEVFGENDDSFMKETTEKQINLTLEIFWTTEIIENEEKYNESRKKLEKKLAAIKNNRKYDNNFQNGIICKICGEREALVKEPINDNDRIGKMKKKLTQTWNKRSKKYQENADGSGRIKDGEYLCGICLGKRVAREYFKMRSFPSIPDIAGEKDYYAILMMDGDNMGQWFSGESGNINKEKINISYHQELSRRLSNYSRNTVPQLVKKCNGKLIYSGGDDVLAFSSLDDVFDLAKELRKAFSDNNKGLSEKATASMGIIIAHETAPLYGLLNRVRILEALAKSYQHPKRTAKDKRKEKDALAIAVLTRSGEIRQVVLPWSLDGENNQDKESYCSLNNLKKFTKALQDDLSSTFLNHFSESFLPLIGRNLEDKLNILHDKKENNELMEVELKRLLKRSLKRESNLNISNLAKEMVNLHEVMPSTLQFVHLLEIARFFKGKEEKNAAASTTC